MSLNPRITDLGSKVRMDWTPDLSGQGYRLYVDGQPVSRTFKPDASSTTFNKPDSGQHRYGLRLMDEVGPLEEAVFPAPDPTPPSDLPFGLQQLESPIVVVPSTLDGAISLPAETAGRDVIVDCKGREGAIRQGGVVTDHSGGPPRFLRIQNMRSRCTKPHGGSGYWHGGIRCQSKAQLVEFLDLFRDENGGPEMTGTDFIAFNGTTSTRYRIQRCLEEAPFDSTTPSGHIDSVQVQGAVGDIEIGLCSFDLAGVRPPNHAGKGFQLASQSVGGVGFHVDVKSVDFRCRGRDGGDSRSGAAVLQEARSITIDFDGVWWECADNLLDQATAFENTVYPYQRTATDYGVRTGTRPNRVLSWDTKPAVGITGEFKERPSGGPRFVTRAMLGY